MSYGKLGSLGSLKKTPPPKKKTKKKPTK